MFYTLDIGNTNQTLIRHNSLKGFNESYSILTLDELKTEIPLIFSSVNDEKIPSHNKRLRAKSYILNNSLFEMNTG